MTSSSVGTYLRYLRRKRGLSQAELAQILGSVSAAQISRHERSRTLPSILTALGYQVVFRMPVSDLFPGLFHTVEAGIEERLREFELEPISRNAKKRTAMPAAQRVARADEHENNESL
jgi:transcriptional regulator with XRE-family HTH domain